jgi:hypothetical protein
LIPNKCHPFATLRIWEPPSPKTPQDGDARLLGSRTSITAHYAKGQ